MDAGEYGGIIAAIGAGLSAIALGCRAGLGLVAKAFTDMATSFKAAGEKLEDVDKRLVKVEHVIEEGRDDIAALHDHVLDNPRPRSIRRERSAPVMPMGSRRSSTITDE